MFKKRTQTWSCPSSSNHDDTRGWTVSPCSHISSRKACRVGVRVKGQTVTLGAGQLQQSQVVTPALTLVLAVDDNLLRREGLSRRPDTHHVLGGVAAKPGGEREQERRSFSWILVRDSAEDEDVFTARGQTHLLTQWAEVSAQQGLIRVPLQRGPPSFSWDWSHTETCHGHVVLRERDNTF